MTILVLLLFALLTFQFWLRQFYFHRTPKLPDHWPAQITDKFIYSPVEGTVVYLHKVGDDARVYKGSDRAYWAHTKCLKKGQVYRQLGIYMTVYDNHYVADSLPWNVVKVTKHKNFNDAPMLTKIDAWLAVFGVKFLNWWHRSHTFIERNDQYCIEFDNGVLMVVTMDVEVNCLTEIEDDARLLYFIHRGSQTDLFIPDHLPLDFVVRVGDKVTYKTVLVRNHE